MLASPIQVRQCYAGARGHAMAMLQTARSKPGRTRTHAHEGARYTPPPIDTRTTIPMSGTVMAGVASAMPQVQGKKSSQVPIGLSTRATSRYGLVHSGDACTNRWANDW